jgi:hypothetical protein
MTPFGHIVDPTFAGLLAIWTVGVALAVTLEVKRV